MILDFESMLIQNFKSYIGKHEFIFGERGPGLYFVNGVNKDAPRLDSNGLGKSTLFDALTWCLTGSTVAGLRNPDVKPWSGHTPTRVKVALLEDGKRHVVSRTLTTNGLKLDGNVVGQDRIDSLLRMNLLTLTHTIILGQERPLFFDLEPRPKMELFSDALNLYRWNDRAARALDAAKELLKEIQSIDIELSSITGSLTTAKAQYERGVKINENWERQHEEELKYQELALVKIRRLAELAENEYSKANLAYESKAVEARQLQRDVAELEKKHNEGRRKFETASLIERNAQEHLEALDKLIESLRNKTCPMCKQSITNQEMKKQLEQCDAEIKLCNRKIKEARVKEAKAALLDIQKEFSETNKHYSDLLVQANNARDDFDTVTAKVAKAQAQRKVAEKAFDDMQRAINPYKKQLRTIEKYIDELRDKKTELNEYRDAVIAQHTRTKFWTVGFRDIRLELITEFLSDLEWSTNEMLEEFGLVGWNVHYTIESETKSGTTRHGLDVLIKSPRSPNRVRWRSWSGGELQRLRLCGALALSEMLLAHAGVKSRLQILDEPTRGLSARGIGDLCDSLAERAQRLKQTILFVDHKTIESSRFIDRINIEINEKGSHINNI